MKKTVLALAAVCAALFASSCRQEAGVEEVWIKNGDRNIYGVLSRPAGRTGKSSLLSSPMIS